MKLKLDENLSRYLKQTLSALQHDVITVADENLLSQPDTVAALRTGLGGRLLAAVLFGSRARGDALPESDWDLLVIAEDLPVRPFKRRLLI